MTIRNQLVNIFLLVFFSGCNISENKSNDVSQNGTADVIYFEGIEFRIDNAGSTKLDSTVTGRIATENSSNDYFVEVIGALKLKKVDIAGHAFGNRVARMLASDHPEMIRSIILIVAGIQSQDLKSTPLKDWSVPEGNAPFLTLQGTNDQVTPPANGVQLQKQFPDGITLLHHKWCRAYDDG